MVDEGTWNSLSADEQAEFNALHEEFINAVHATGLLYGHQFAEHYDVVCFGRIHRISDGVHWLRGIESHNEAVIRALYADACQNLGR